MAFGGVLALGRRDWLALAAVISVPVACLSIMLRQELFFARFALPLLPPLAILAGLGIGALAEAIQPAVADRRPDGAGGHDDRRHAAPGHLDDAPA